jgi:hypothetical protein
MKCKKCKIEMVWIEKLKEWFCLNCHKEVKK